MIGLRLQIRRAVARDRRQIASLVFHESNTHRHLDWRAALEWLGDRNFWVLEDRDTLVAALACPEDPPNVAWIRLFAYDPHLSGPEAWSALWEFARADIFTANPDAQVASIVTKKWFQSLLLASGFLPRLNIVMLELKLEGYLPPGASGNYRIRPMREFDLDEVAEIDLEAFGPFWHNTADSLFRARSQSIWSTVAENESGLIGFQISTGNPFGVHLARLGVRVEAQGRGVGSALVNDLIQNSGVIESGRLSVNTQEDNFASLRLYEKLGFNRTGDHYPVLVYDMAGSG
jgi:ribosomal protein S18 acetylase RimI-like enzyme